MKKILTYLVLIFICTACNKEENEWQKAGSANSIVQLLNFIEKFPESSHKTEAFKKIQQIKSLKVLEKYFSGVMEITSEGLYHVNINPDDSISVENELKRIDVLENLNYCFAMYFTKNTEFNQMDGLNIGSKYRIRGYALYPKKISVDSLNKIANKIKFENTQYISHCHNAGKKFINADSMKVIYRSHSMVSPSLFDTLCNIKALDDELEIIFHYYKIKNEIPDSLFDKKLKPVLINEISLLK